MDLNEFVTQTLIQIATGVKGAQATIEGLGGAVAPFRSGKQLMEPVEFDVAVVVNASGDTGGKLQVAFWGFSAGMDGATHTSEQATSRVRFRVPVYLPPGNTDEHMRAVRAANTAERKVTEDEA